MFNPYPKHWLKAIILTTTLTLLFTGSVFAQNDPIQTSVMSQFGTSPIKTFAHGMAANSAAWSPDGTMLMRWLNDPNFTGVNTVQIWQVANNVNVQTFRHGTGIISVTWSPDQTRVLTTTNDGGIHVWGMESGEEIFTMSHDSQPWGATWNSVGDRILSWSTDSTARLWNAETGQQMHKWQHEEEVGGAVLNPDERRVLTWSRDGAVVVWERESGVEVVCVRHDSAVSQAMWSPDGNRIMTVSVDRTLRVTDSTSGNEIYNFELDGSSVGARWNGNGSLILGRASGYIALWNAMTSDQIYTLTPPNTTLISDVQFTPSETKLAIVSSQMVWIYDAATAEVDSTFLHDDIVRSLSFNRDGNLALTLTLDGTAHVWQTLNASKILDLQHTNGFVNYAG